jgi:hypothetical protein
MRLVTEHTFQAGIVLIRVDAVDLRSLTVGVEKTGMAPKAELPAPVQDKFPRFSRMGKGRSVTIFTFNVFMLCGGKGFRLPCMAGPAEFPASVFYRKILPFLNIGLPIPAICIPSFMNSEIIGYQDAPGDQDDRRKSQNYIQRAQYMHKLRFSKIACDNHMLPSIECVIPLSFV